MTVSRAFKSDASISPELRKKILKKAKDMGYEPDRMVSELMTSFASRRPVNYQETFAAIWWPDRWAEVGLEEGYNSDLYRGLVDGAKVHGRGIDHIVLEKEMTARVVNRMLHARNIKGVILTPRISTEDKMPELDWEHLSTILIGSSPRRPNFHRTHASHYNIMVKVLETLHARQYKRPCFVVHSDIEIRTRRAYTAAFLAWGHPLEHIWQTDTHQPEALSKWLKKMKPDVIIGDWELWHEIIPEEDQTCGFVALSVRSEDGPIAGVYQNIGSIAKCAVDLLVRARLQHDQGEPQEPVLMLTTGKWVEGATLRALPKEEAK